MGLAASQARFLGLTARKSNVEYQVQQINQQRTALSNEVLGLYTEYNKLDVPVPPAIDDFNKTIYTLESTYEDYEIESFTRIPSGTYAGYYDVVLNYGIDNAVVYPQTTKCSISATKTGPGDYSPLTIVIGSNIFKYDDSTEETLKNSTITKITDPDDYAKCPGLDTVRSELKEPPYYMFKLGDKYFYTNGDSLDLTDLTDFNSSYTFYYQGIRTQEGQAHAKAAISQASNGRLSSIQFIECEEDPDLVGHTYQISTTTREDQKSYQEAMNDYQYRKDIYEKKVQTINNKTATLQKEDRDLELQLNQLDTEQNALSTEMDSVSKVIEETVDSVFKTFQ